MGVCTQRIKEGWGWGVEGMCVLVSVHEGNAGGGGYKSRWGGDYVHVCILWFLSHHGKISSLFF